MSCEWHRPSYASTGLGWIRHRPDGFSDGRRLLTKGADVAIYNRTRAKAEPWCPPEDALVDAPAALAERDIVFTMVSTSDDLLRGDAGAARRAGAPRACAEYPRRLLHRLQEASARWRAAAASEGCALLAAAGQRQLGRWSRRASQPGRLGQPGRLRRGAPLLEALGEGVSYVGECELARIVKICPQRLPRRGHAVRSRRSRCWRRRPARPGTRSSISSTRA